jgi:hypothetical protein
MSKVEYTEQIMRIASLPILFLKNDKEIGAKLTLTLQALAVGIKGTNCSDPLTFQHAKIILAGWLGAYADYNSKKTQKKLTDLWESRCRRVTVDATFEFLALIVCVALLVYGIMRRKSGGSGSYV